MLYMHNHMLYEAVPLSFKKKSKKFDAFLPRKEASISELIIIFFFKKEE